MATADNQVYEGNLQGPSFRGTSAATTGALGAASPSSEPADALTASEVKNSGKLTGWPLYTLMILMLLFGTCNTMVIKL